MVTTKVRQLVARLQSDDSGFMGTTHALSAVAASMWVAALCPSFFEKTGGNIFFLAAFMIVVAGASLVPDLDNTNSTSKSSLGKIGDLFSAFFRVTSGIIQRTIKTSRDDPEPNVHRGFYHTLVSAFVLGALVSAGMAGAGKIFAVIITWLCLHMSIAALFTGKVKQVKRKTAGELILFGASLAATVVLFLFIPGDVDFSWLGVAFATGCVIHIVGDMFTTYGTPALWPIPIKGKMWYCIRFLKIKANGVVENYIFKPFFAIAIAAAVVTILLNIT